MALFNRSASLILTTNAEQITISGLRIIFTCTKSADQTKNGATIQIYNLSESTRAKFDIKDAKVTLNAGYIESGGESVLFVGDITQSIHKAQFPDVITSLELSDGYNALKNARISESLKEGTTIKQVIDTLTKATGLPIKEITDFADDQYTQGISLVGSVYDLMNEIAAKIGLDWSIQDNEVQVLKKDQTTNDKAVVLSKSTGLVGFPERLIKDANRLDSPDVKKLKVKSLLIPQLLPARKIELKSDAASGIFRINNVQHSGDTHGELWNSTCEVQAV